MLNQLHPSPLHKIITTSTKPVIHGELAPVMRECIHSQRDLKLRMITEYSDKKNTQARTLTHMHSLKKHAHLQFVSVSGVSQRNCHPRAAQKNKRIFSFFNSTFTLLIESVNFLLLLTAQLP